MQTADARPPRIFTVGGTAGPLPRHCLQHRRSTEYGCGAALQLCRVQMWTQGWPRYRVHTLDREPTEPTDTRSPVLGRWSQYKFSGSGDRTRTREGGCQVTACVAQNDVRSVDIKQKKENYETSSELTIDCAYIGQFSARSTLFYAEVGVPWRSLTPFWPPSPNKRRISLGGRAFVDKPALYRYLEGTYLIKVRRES